MLNTVFRKKSNEHSIVLPKQRVTIKFAVFFRIVSRIGNRRLIEREAEPESEKQIGSQTSFTREKPQPVLGAEFVLGASA